MTYGCTGESNQFDLCMAEALDYLYVVYALWLIEWIRAREIYVADLLKRFPPEWTPNDVEVYVRQTTEF